MSEMLAREVATRTIVQPESINEQNALALNQSPPDLKLARVDTIESVPEDHCQAANTTQSAPIQDHHKPYNRAWPHTNADTHDGIEHPSKTPDHCSDSDERSNQPIRTVWKESQ